MDDIEDDARYPPNPQNHRPKLSIHPQFSRHFTDIEPHDDDDDEEEDADSEDISRDHHQQQQQQHQPVDYVEDEPDSPDSDDIIINNNNVEGDDDDDDDSSLESRGKRQKLDKFAHGFEFVPRKPQPSQPPTILPNSKAPVKNSPPDWSEDSTFVLLEAWGDLYVQNGRKSLRSDEWSEVAKKVNQDSRITRSDSQCRNRLDTLKKKYKKEKAKMVENVNSKSDWVYFKKMDSLMSPSAPPPPIQTPAAEVASKSSPVRLACGVDAGEYVFSSSRVYMNRANGMDEMRDSPGDTGTDDDENGGGEEEDESDGLPPTVKEKKGRERTGDSLSSFRMLADSIQKFGEVYEKIESSKRQQMAELERMRKEFHRDLEAQKRQILERAQAEIARMRQEEGEEDEEDDEEERGDEDEDDELDGSAENLSG